MKNKLHILENLRLLDDIFMTVVFDDNIPATEMVLQIVTEEKDLSVTHMTAQREIRNPYGRSVRMDILAEDAAGRRFDVEVQREKRGAVPQRARFHSGMLDSRLLKAGERDFTKLPDTYVIFITEDDVIGQGRPIYRMERQIGAEGGRFGDGSCILYVNGAYRGEDPIGKLMHDFHCTRADDMYYPVLAERGKIPERAQRREKRDGRSIRRMEKRDYRGRTKSGGAGREGKFKRDRP